MSLYQELKAAGVKIGNHCSDLYFEWTPESREILKRHKELVKRSSLFTSCDPADNRATWCDTPFEYIPFWESKLLSKEMREAPRE